MLIRLGVATPIGLATLKLIDKKVQVMISITAHQQMKVMNVSDFVHTITVPEFQRDQDIAHVDSIYSAMKAVLDTGHSPMLPGCLIVAQLPSGEQLLVDGNHRLSAMSRLQEHGLRIFVNIIQCSTMLEAEWLFRVTNNNLPMPQLPPLVKIADVKLLLGHYKLRYGKLFSNSKSGNCQRPNVHERGFTEALGRILEHGAVESQITSTISQYNHELSRRHPRTFRKSSSDTIGRMQELMDTCMSKGGFYIGLVCCNSDYSALLEQFGIIDGPKLQRAPMTKNLRLQVWDRYFGDARYGLCKVCGTTISVTEFHCAHDIAHAQGGVDAVTNLYPCCAICNLSMGQSSWGTADQ